MIRRETVSSFAAGALIVAWSSGGVLAMDLVTGGYGVDIQSYSPPAPLAMQRTDFTSSEAAAGFTFDFTPRNSGSLFSTGPDEADRGVSLSFGVQQDYGDLLRLDTIGLGGGATTGAIEPLEGLAIGGAFSLSEWQLTGSMGRASLLGQEADVFSAGLGYGRVNARLVYGTLPETATREAGDLLMLSTDLAAWSWLTLQGDVAVSDSLSDEPLTVGRVGLRVNF